MQSFMEKNSNSSVVSRKLIFGFTCQVAVSSNYKTLIFLSASPIVALELPFFFFFLISQKSPLKMNRFYRAYLLLSIRSAF